MEAQLNTKRTVWAKGARVESAFSPNMKGSLAAIAKSLKRGRKTIYLVGNRIVKKV
jgi:hypothetical protein